MATRSLAHRLLCPRTVGLILLPLALQLAPPFTRPAGAEVDNKTAARSHFDKGVAAFNDRRFGEAAEEFETAYRLSPAYVVLYNIGQVSAALGRSVEAVEAYEKYLKQGASSITSERRQAVLDEIEKQRARIGAVAVRTFPEGASVRLDGALVGQTPLSVPLKVNQGRHTVEAQKDGHRSESRDLTVEGRNSVNLELTLEPLALPPVASAPGEPAAREATPSERTIVLPVQIAAPPPSEERISERIVERTIEKPGAPGSSYATIQRIVGLTLMAGGIATATTGGIIAYKGAVASHDASERLASGSLSDAEWDATKLEFDAAKSRNQRGWIIAAVGAAITLAGGVVVATVPDRVSSVALTSRSNLALAPCLWAGGGGFSAHFRF